MRIAQNIKFLKFILPLLILSVMLLVSSCDSAISLKSGENGTLIDEKNGRIYIDCSISLRAKSLSGENIYAKGPKNDRVDLYVINGLDPAEWLTEDIREGIPSVFRELNAIPDEPSIEDFDSKIIMTQEEAVAIQIGIIDDKDIVSRYINELLANENVMLPSHDSLDYSYTLRFESDKYSGLQYLVQYYVDHSGKSYLYDRGTRKCVLLSSDSKIN